MSSQLTKREQLQQKLAKKKEAEANVAAAAAAASTSESESTIEPTVEVKKPVVDKKDKPVEVILKFVF
jgi:hypothetical protein